MNITLIRTEAQLRELEPEWSALFYASSTPNPFAHPIWMIAWARHFIRPAQLYLITVRGDDGVLLAVAPFYRRAYRLGPQLVATSLQLFATGSRVGLTELTQILIRPNLERRVLGAIMRHLGEHASEWDWIELVLPSEHGWFDPRWLPDDGPGAGSFVLHKGTRACVLLPLPRTGEELRAGLKHNVKESLRHGTNSLKRAGHSWDCAFASDAEAISVSVERLQELHRARARIRRKVCHADYLDDPADRAFLRDAARQMGEAGHLTAALLRIDGGIAAAHLLLHANGRMFFSISGFEARWWQYGVATTLMGACLRHGIERGDTLVNLSTGPDGAKLRWSEVLELHQEFLVVGPRRRSRLAFGLFWQARAATVLCKDSYRRRRT